jgi:hypothetical protein
MRIFFHDTHTSMSNHIRNMVEDMSSNCYAIILYISFYCISIKHNNCIAEKPKNYLELLSYF